MLREIDLEKLLMVICLTMLIVAGLNALAYAALRRGDEANMIELTRKAAQRARNPWKDEEMALQELSRLVSSLQENEAGQQETGKDESPAENHGTPGDA